MKSFLTLCIPALLCLFIACKPKDDVKQEEPTVTEPAANTNATGNPGGGHDFTFLTDKLFHYKASNTVGGSGANEYEGQWIDMEPDGTYKSGKLKEQTHTGKWDYNSTKKILLLRPDDSAFKISEWNVMHNNDMVIFVGTQTYGNNATQIQLIRANELP